ncbi:hypothetical protein RhiirA1_450458 [Rhizophagus irregularis]|uniref:Uncharacterized protein n=1 Tax=Rhizophagus irregularis TaxID=588596 RepID=A0A2N0SEN9_9GLOM|nr:hypothetical protein RhiirA1_450458 [Rhizophagus irregularis]
MKDQEKELHSEKYIAKNKDTGRDEDKFSCNLATILAREHEIVAFEFRLEKLKNDIKRGQEEYYNEFKFKEVPMFHPKFLRHIKKVRSYAGFTKEIIVCARKTKYKPLFSSSIIIDDQPYFRGKILSEEKKVIQNARSITSHSDNSGDSTDNLDDVDYDGIPSIQNKI